MGILELISAICLILACVFIIIMVLMQDSKRGMSNTLTGGSNDNFYQRNSGRSREAMLTRATKTAAIIFFVVTLIVNVFAIYFTGGGNDAPVVDDSGYDADYSVPDYENWTDEDWDNFFIENNDGTVDENLVEADENQEPDQNAGGEDENNE